MLSAAVSSKSRPKRAWLQAHLAGLVVAGLASPVKAATDQYGTILINQAAALAGNVTPGDAPGFPVTLSTPGSYRLIGGLTVNDTANAIDVRAAEVTLDLGGNRIIGSGRGITAIQGNGNRSLTVRNGTIRAFATYAIEASGTFVKIDRMRLTNNGHGIYLWVPISGPALNRAVITNSVIVDNRNYGIVCDSGFQCRINGVQVSGNGFTNVYIFDGSILNSQIWDSGNFGVSVNGFVAMGDTFLNGNDSGNLSGTPYQLSPNRCGVNVC